MDGEFVEQETIWAEDVEKINTELVQNVHLMIENPGEHVEDFIDAGGDIINFHFEAAEDVQGVIEKIHEGGADAGIALNPETPLSEIEDFLEDVDQVLVMSVHPGKGGQGFIEEVLSKIEELREMEEDLDIEVDGGINEETGELSVEAGANVLCSGSYVHGFDNPKIAIDILRNL